jgi:hypothetical protein
MAVEDLGDDEPIVSGLELNFNNSIYIVGGSSHFCNLGSDSNIKCWGKAIGSTGEGGLLGSGRLEDIGDDELATSVDGIKLFKEN